MFCMRLAYGAGRLDWRRALNDIDVKELREWQAFDSLEPVGPWQPASMVASVNANEMRMVEAAKTGQKLPPESFYPQNAFVPGVGEKLREKEAEESCEAIDGMIGL